MDSEEIRMYDDIHRNYTIPLTREEDEEGELWRIIPGFENYIISTAGRVRNRKTGRFLLIQFSPTGYMKIGLRAEGKTYNKLVHRLVAKTFVYGYRPSYRAKHIDNDKLNNHAYNLKWVPREESIRHPVADGVYNAHTLQKQEPGQPRLWVRIIELDEPYRTIVAVAKRLQVTPNAVARALHSNLRFTVKGYHIEYYEKKKRR